MDTKDKLTAALTQAMRSGDDLRKRTIRLALSSIRMAEMDQDGEIDEARVQSILQKEVKARQESIEAAQTGGRTDLIETAEAEIAVLKEYLPEQLSEEEISKLADLAIEETQAAKPADMGKVMKALLPRIAGRASNSQVSQIVKQKLND
jgi:uncharacterized protein